MARGGQAPGMRACRTGPHEQHHELSRAPVALVALLGVAAVLGWVRPIGRWADRIRAQIEIAADAYALAHGLSRPAIALAIVKLSSPPSSPGIASFESAVEIRLRALVRQEAPPAHTRRDDVGLILAFASLVVVACSALTI